MASHRIATYSVDGSTRYGVVAEGGLVDLSARFGKDYPTLREAIAAGALTKLAEDAAKRSPDHALDAITWQPPIPAPEKIICIGVNYPDRNEEYKDGSERPKYPSIFTRSHTSFAAPGQPILRPRESQQLDYEGEIVIIIGQGGRRIPQESALSHVFAYSCANEGSVRDWLRHSKFNVTQGKNFDRSGSIGPWLVTADEVGSAPLRVVTRVNGEERQNDTSDRMIFQMPYLIHYLSTFCTLEPGDVILTGTPSGAGARFDPPRYLEAGDEVEVEVSRVGLLRNKVVDDE